MKAVRMQGEYYIVLIPEARVELVLPKEQFVEGLRRAKAWSRRQRQTAREAQMASAAGKVRDDVLG